MPTLLTVDIGGTNCRFARFSIEKGALTLMGTARRQTADIPDTQALMDACAAALLAPGKADALVIGMAGPIAGQRRTRLTNAPLELDLSDAETRYGVGACLLVNDFLAEACACLTPIGAGAFPVLGPRDATTGDGTIGIIGAGTGLGTASLVRDSLGAWLPLPAEGGHAAFPFTGKEEADFQAFAASALGLSYLRGDDVLTGRGLCLLHAFLTGERREAAEVAAQGLSRETETLRWYARFYGRACRDWALSTLCTGGLFITGGIARRNPLVMRCASFRESFYDSPQRNLLERLPVRRYADEASGLWGSAWLAARLIGALPA